MKNSKIFLRTAIIYVRDYLKESLSTYNLNEQEDLIVNYTSVNGYRILEVFREKNKSAKSFNRPQFQEMIEYIRTNKWKIKFLIVVDAKRLSTDHAGLQKFRHFLKRNRIGLISIADSISRYAGKQAKQPSRQSLLP